MAASIAGVFWQAVRLIGECRGTGSGSSEGVFLRRTRKNLASADEYLDSCWRSAFAPV